LKDAKKFGLRAFFKKGKLAVEGQLLNLDFVVKNVQLKVEGDGLDIPEMNSVKGMEVTCQQRPGNTTSICMSCKKLQTKNDPWLREKSGPAEWTLQEKKRTG
jgi:hypothetical protein